LSNANTSRNQKENQKRTQRREDAKNPQSFLCGAFAALRLCVKVFAFFATIVIFNELKTLIDLPKIVLPSNQT